MKRRIERPFFDAELAIRRDKDVAGDAIAMFRTTGNRLENEKIERTLERVSSHEKHLS
jgi:hypothetical protein